LITLQIVSFGQTANATKVICTDANARRISSRGVSLGMKLDDVLTVIGLSKEDKQTASNSIRGRSYFGRSIYEFYPTQKDIKFEGIRSYNFIFFDEQLVSLGVTYYQPQWKDVNEFGEAVIKLFDLPKIENWKDLETRQREMNQKRIVRVPTIPPLGELSLECENHYISLVQPQGYGGSTQPPELMQLTVFDARHIKEMIERERRASEEKERAKKIFKP
jgi:hypothetical protein